MRKRILWVLTGCFFLLMLFGTFFHDEVDGLFREQVRAAVPQKETVQTAVTVMIGGEEVPAEMTKEFLTVPVSAVKDGRVYVIEQVEVPGGSYFVVRLREVETDGEREGRIRITCGLSEGEEIAEVFTDTLSDGMRVRIIR